MVYIDALVNKTSTLTTNDLWIIREGLCLTYELPAKGVSDAKSVTEEWPGLYGAGAEFASGIDAGFINPLHPEELWLFRKEKCLLYNLNDHKILESEFIAFRWPQFPQLLQLGIDAAAPDPGSMCIWFFRNDEYIKYDIQKDQICVAEKIAKRFDQFTSGIDAAACDFHNKLLWLFRDSEFVVHDIAKRKTSRPEMIGEHWPELKRYFEPGPIEERPKPDLKLNYYNAIGKAYLGKLETQLQGGVDTVPVAVWLTTAIVRKFSEEFGWDMSYLGRVFDAFDEAWNAVQMPILRTISPTVYRGRLAKLLMRGMEINGIMHYTDEVEAKISKFHEAKSKLWNNDFFRPIVSKHGSFSEEDLRAVEIAHRYATLRSWLDDNLGKPYQGDHFEKLIGEVITPPLDDNIRAEMNRLRLADLGIDPKTLAEEVVFQNADMDIYIANRVVEKLQSKLNGVKHSWISFGVINNVKKPLTVNLDQNDFTTDVTWVIGGMESPQQATFTLNYEQKVVLGKDPNNSTHIPNGKIKLYDQRERKKLGEIKISADKCGVNYSCEGPDTDEDNTVVRLEWVGPDKSFSLPLFRNARFSAIIPQDFPVAFTRDVFSHKFRLLNNTQKSEGNIPLPTQIFVDLPQSNDLYWKWNDNAIAGGTVQDLSDSVQDLVAEQRRSTKYSGRLFSLKYREKNHWVTILEVNSDGRRFLGYEIRVNPDLDNGMRALVVLDDPGNGSPDMKFYSEGTQYLDLHRLDAVPYIVIR